jgi:curved DNA-binding protein CbpA
MNGQLSEHPAVELIREISHKNLSGKLQLQHDKVIVVVYFLSGTLIYAAGNLKSFRLSEYLLKAGLITPEVLFYLGKNVKDLDLAPTLLKEKRLSQSQSEQIQTRQVSDVLLTALAWAEGSWEFDSRSRLDGEVDLKLDIPNLLFETARRLPESLTASRFRNPSEIFSPVATPPNISNLSGNEVLILSRIDRPTKLDEVLTVSGLSKAETLQVLYSLAIVDAIARESWQPAFREGVVEKVQEKKGPPSKVEPTPPVEVVDPIEGFLTRLSHAETHYEVLDLDQKSNMSELKSAYYDIARKYHPDRYRSTDNSLLLRVESAFARVTQAYDTLRDAGQRATYDSKLDSQRRAARLAQSAPKASSPKANTKESDEGGAGYVDPVQLSEANFKEGFAALELGQRNVALGMLGAAAKAVPNEARYRAYYGRALAIHESTRRLAEAELQAAVKLDPKNSDYRVMLAELYRDLGFNVRAKSEAERAVAADANNRKARELLKSLG